jgi:hypothetical protein
MNLLDDLIQDVSTVILVGGFATLVVASLLIMGLGIILTGIEATRAFWSIVPKLFNKLFQR